LPISLNDIPAYHHVTYDATLTQNHLEPTQCPSSPSADIPSPPDTLKSTTPNYQPLYCSTQPIQPLAHLKNYHVNHVFFLAPIDYSPALSSTQHLISRHVSYSILSPIYQPFISNICGLFKLASYQ